MMSFTEKVKWMLTSKDVDMAAIRLLKRIFIEDKTPWWFSITAICFAMMSILMGIILPPFFGLWVEYENVEWPILDPIIMQSWGIYGYLVLLLFGYGMIAIVTDTRRK